jgi:RNA polymerase sigma-70 factor (ECF subfamily)
LASTRTGYNQQLASQVRAGQDRSAPHARSTAHSSATLKVKIRHSAARQNIQNSNKSISGSPERPCTMADVAPHPTLTPDTSGDIVRRAIAGDRAALGDLLIENYDVVARRVQRVLPAWLADQLSVDDLVQQSFVAAIANIKLCNSHSPQSFAAWLDAIAECQAQNAVSQLMCQKRGGGRSPARMTDDSNASSWNCLVEALAVHTGTASHKMAEQEAVRAIQVAVAGLPQDQRAAVVLHHLEGQSIEATAAEMARTPGAVRGLLQRARRELRAALGRSSRWFAKKS